ncbi:MAG TPA: hypothetical protein VGK03_04560 [Geothrix sp.]
MARPEVQQNGPQAQGPGEQTQPQRQVGKGLQEAHERRREPEAQEDRGGRKQQAHQGQEAAEAGRPGGRGQRERRGGRRKTHGHLGKARPDPMEEPAQPSIQGH